MKTDIFLPNTLKVGFQERYDTYTGKLAYVTYMDEKGVLRKEKSWDNWRNHDLEPMDIENVPTSGFVLNKKAGGGSGWDSRQTYVRMFDPRGFEFEITIQNLLYILENTNSIKGKGLEGEFVYGWSGPELVLIPTSAPDYQELIDFNKLKHENKKITAKELKIGATYKNKANKDIVYLGRFTHYCPYDGENKGKAYFFHILDETEPVPQFAVKSLGNSIIGVLSENCIENFAELIEKLGCNPLYSPCDVSKKEYVSYEFDELKEELDQTQHVHCYTKWKEKIEIKRFIEEDGTESYVVFSDAFTVLKEGSYDEIFKKYKPMYLNKYLENGNIYDKKLQYYY